MNFVLFIIVICIVTSVYGGTKVLMAPVVAEYMHAENANNVVGMSMMSISIAALVGPTAASILYDSTAPPSQVYSVFFYAMSLLTSLGLACLMGFHPLVRNNYINLEMSSSARLSAGDADGDGPNLYKLTNSDDEDDEQLHDDTALDIHVQSSSDSLSTHPHPLQPSNLNPSTPINTHTDSSLSLSSTPSLSSSSSSGSSVGTGKIDDEELIFSSQEIQPLPQL